MSSEEEAKNTNNITTTSPATIGELAMIPLKEIIDNPRNNRDINTGALTNSIKRFGLKQPLTVYRSGEHEFTLLAGHRRKHALIEAGFGDDAKIPCYILEKPKSDFDEERDLSSGNNHRSSPEQLQEEVRLAARTWTGADEANALTKEEKAVLSKQYRDEFIKENESNDAFKRDPAKYIRDNFRPKLSYIRDVTGMTSSNATIKGTLHEVMGADDVKSDAEKVTMGDVIGGPEEEETTAEKKPKKVKSITYKDAKKQALKLRDLLTVASLDPLQAGIRDQLMEVLEDFIAAGDAE